MARKQKRQTHDWATIMPRVEAMRAKGLTVKEAAARVGISVATLATHMNRAGKISPPVVKPARAKLKTVPAAAAADDGFIATSKRIAGPRVIGVLLMGTSESVAESFAAFLRETSRGS